jgi:hypothetical protein
LGEYSGDKKKRCRRKGSYDMCGKQEKWLKARGGRVVLWVGGQTTEAESQKKESHIVRLRTDNCV